MDVPRAGTCFFLISLAAAAAAAAGVVVDSSRPGESESMTIGSGSTTIGCCWLPVRRLRVCWRVCWRVALLVCWRVGRYRPSDAVLASSYDRCLWSSHHCCWQAPRVLLGHACCLLPLAVLGVGLAGRATEIDKNVANYVYKANKSRISQFSPLFSSTHNFSLKWFPHYFSLKCG